MTVGVRRSTHTTPWIPEHNRRAMPVPGNIRAVSAWRRSCPNRGHAGNQHCFDAFGIDADFRGRRS
jgi:hypothetical protein